jgi:amino acid adenylation domain-containing protein/non-ribosomal peptide synthase protein (TIGR01720 family)
LFGLNATEIGLHMSFLEMGADSLSLLRASQSIQEKFGVKIPFRMMLDELSTIDELAAYLAHGTSAETTSVAVNVEAPGANGAAPVVETIAVVAPTPLPALTQQPNPASNIGAELPDGKGMERVFTRQLDLLSQQMKLQAEIMAQQIELLRAGGANGAAGHPVLSGDEPPQSQDKLARSPSLTAHTLKQDGRVAAIAQGEQQAPPGRQFEPESFVPYHPIKKDRERGLTAQQQEHIDDLIARVTSRTRESKRLTQTYRAVLADNRASAGFRQTWKEMCYPLIVERGLGSKVIDADGHKYIDLTMGFGALLFGHSPDFLINALQEAITQGVRLGGQSHLAGQAAELICEMTGVERVAFCNSGTEAVMSALRIARTVTGRTKVALFEGSYHGTFDGVMVRPGERAADGSFQARPVSPGVSQSMVDDVLLLGYDDKASLDVLRAHAHELAAILIELPRSRRPDIEPKEFLHELRKITSEAGVALVFDEVVTGFRFHPGGGQALFGVQADLVAYGKALGGGVPVAAVAGKAAFMDAVDGGMWYYGDASYPRAETTFVAGTYFKNPLIVAAVTSVLKRLKASGPKLYEELNGRTARLARMLNELFEQMRAPMRVACYGSLFRFFYPGELKLMELFYYHLLLKGIYICETRACFLSTAHTDEDVDAIVKAVKETVIELRSAGVIPDAPAGDGSPIVRKLEDLSGRLSNDLTTAKATPDVEAASTDIRTLPLTEGQKQLWFLTQMSAEASVAYNLSNTVRMRGPLRLAALRSSLQAVVNNHEALRITFNADGGAQQIHRELEIDLPLLDWAGGDGRLQAWLDEEARRPFDLVKGPLLRAYVLRLTDERHLIVLTTHHIVIDGLSNGILMGELIERYTAACAGVAPNLLPSAQFSEYVLWEAAKTEETGLRAAEDYWLGQFAEPSPSLGLPTDYPRHAVQTHTGARELLTLDTALAGSLERLGAQHNSTLFMLLLAGFNLLLHKLSQQPDIVVGIHAAGQAVFGMPVVGYCVNLLPLRSRLIAQCTFQDYLAAVKRVVLDAYEHQTYPFSRLVRKLKLSPDLGRSPLVTVVFNLEEAGKWQSHGVEVELLQNTTGSTQFDLSINAKLAGGELHLECDFNTGLFEPETIRRWLRHFRTLLRMVVDGSYDKVAGLSLLDNTERRQLLVEWNSTTRRYTQSKCLHEYIEAQVERTPESIALTFEEQEVTYSELNRRANRLAAHLRDLGVWPDARVAICMERSVEMVVALLATLKAGGAYVPLDPSYPPERLAYMLEDSAPAVLLTHNAALAAPVGYSPTLLILNLDSDERQWAGRSEGNPDRAGIGLDARNLAYIIYTSGSTGKPRGVAVSHLSICNHMEWVSERFTISGQDCLLQKTPFTFDASVWEFCAPLMSGGRMVIARPEGHRDPTYLISQIQERQVSLLQVVPSLLPALIDEGRLGECRSLRAVFCGGEALSDQLQRRLREELAARLVNFYGPTEVTINATYWEASAGEGRVAIGRPVSNTRAYVLGEEMEALPVGVQGELYLGGAQLARGYLNQVEMTAERFVPDPFGLEPGGRLYRTGDRVRWRSDGNLEFVGRMDEQVKLRGYRIELGEIEARLAEHSEVRDAVAVMREEEESGKRLVAYYTGRKIGAEALRIHLASRLPEHMIPAAYVHLESLPLMPNGKLDRGVLPAPDAGAYVRNSYEPPVGEIETKLAGIWSELLDLEQVGRYDNFFELGGHSLLAVSMVEQLRREGLSSNIHMLFTAPTLQVLAEAIKAAIPSEFEAPPNLIPEGCRVITPEMLTLVELTQPEIDGIVAGVPGGAANIQDIYSLAPLQEGILFHHLMSDRGDVYLYRILLAFDTRERMESFVGALGMVIARHDILRTSVVWEGLRDPVQVVWREASLSIEEVALDPLGAEAEDDAAARLRARFDPQRVRLDVRRAPLMHCVGAYDAAKERWLLLCLSHHLTIDNITMEMIVQEAGAYLLGEADQLPEQLPFRKFVAQARSEIRLAEHEAFFRELLGDVVEPTAPFGLLEMRGEGSEIGEARMELDRILAGRMRGRARALGVSAATLCHLAWGRVLSQVAGVEDVVFGTVLLGRMGGAEGADRALGLFINTLPIRLRVGRESVEKGVRRAHALLGELMRHEHTSLALAQKCSGVAAPTPLFSCLLNYRHGMQQAELSSKAARAWVGIQVLDSGDQTNYPLTMSVDDLGDGFALTAQAVRSIEPRRICDYMRTALEQLVEALESSPWIEVRALEVLPEDERRQLLEEWNETEADYPKERCVHELFEEQVQRSPEAAALSYEDVQMSYAELNARANRLAAHLRGLGVGPDARVAICMERSVEMVVALLAVLKAGGAYVPLDPSYPPERLAYMLEDSAPAVLLTHNAALAAPVEYSPELLILNLDSDERQWADQSELNLDRAGIGLDARSLAYILYTSGSTGKPKGVAISHLSLCNHMEWFSERFSVSGRDCVLQKTPFTFDASVWEFYAPLMSGGRMVIARPEGHRDPTYLISQIKERQVSLLQVVPSLLSLLIDEGGLGECRTLRAVFCGGEALSEQLQRRLREQLAARLVNLYGPTEVTIDSIYWEASAGDERVAIGRPVSNTQAYVLGKEMEALPVWVQGELYLGGAQLARGYLNRVGMTGERFVPDPFGLEPGGRLYRTGDRVRWRSDGNLEFVGRVDEQVKLRGYRIELGEIEETVMRHPGVAQCAVMVREDGLENQRLVAYVAPEADAELEMSELRERLREWLPEHMAPNAIVVLERMPLTVNGKLDRRALPLPERIMREAEKAYLAPRTSLEKILADIWSDVLAVEQVGVNDNFFELGGDSILSIQVIARANQAGVRLKPAQLFLSQTIAELAEEISRTDEKWADQAEVTDEMILTPIQHWFFERNPTNPHLFSQAMLIDIPSHLDQHLIEQSIEQLLLRHDALRLRFTRGNDGMWKQTTATQGQVTPFSFHDLSGSVYEDQLAIIRSVSSEIQTKLNLQDGPLMSAALFELGETMGRRLLIVIHHLAVDITSLRILFEEFQTVCEQLRRGDAVNLPAKTASFKQWTRQLERFAKSEELLGERSYWLAETRKHAPRAPLDDEGINNEESSRALSVKLSEEETQALFQDTAKAYRTQVSDVLLTALVLAFREWTGEESMLVDLEGHGREEITEEFDVQRTVGWFTAIFPIRLDVSGVAGPIEALKRVKEQVRSVPRGGIGYGILKYLTEDQRLAAELRGLPTAEIGFNCVVQKGSVLSNRDHIRPSLESPALMTIGQRERPYALMITGQVVEGQLTVNWEYSSNLHKASTIERLARLSIESVREIIRQSRLGDTNFTPADFPQASIGQKDLDALIAAISHENGETA